MSSDHPAQDAAQPPPPARIVEDKPRFHSMQVKPMPSSLLMMPKTEPRVVKQAPLMAQPKATATTTHNNNNRHQNGWKLEALAPLPAIYALERTYLKVSDTARNICERLSACLEAQSMAAVYSNHELSAEVETADGTLLTVRLWKSQEYVLVETQKVQGCGFSYMQAAKALLRAAKSVSGAAPVSVPRRVVPAIPASQQQEQQHHEGLQIAMQLLALEREDARGLALQSLEQLARCNATVARAILQGAHGLDERLVNLMTTSQDRRAALAVVAACLTSAQQDVSSMTAVWTSRPFLVALLEAVTTAAERPHDARAAAECWQVLLPALQRQGWEGRDDLNASLTAAQDLHHAQLQGACRQCLAVLQSAA